MVESRMALSHPRGVVCKRFNYESQYATGEPRANSR